MYSLNFSNQAIKDLDYFKKNDKELLEKILILLKSITQTPYIGIGKPEPLKHKFSGYWSRRIDKKHRIIYCLKKNIIEVYSCKGHYTG